jgi:transposase
MHYFAGLDISMDETLVCVLGRKGVVVRESKTASTAQAVAGELAKAPSCHRIMFETGRMAPILFHGLNQLGLPVVSVESQQAYQAIKSLDPRDRSQRRPRSGAFGSHWFLQARACEVASRARRPLVDQRAQEAGRPAGDLGKLDPWSRDRVRDPALSRAQRRLRQPGS